MTHRSFTRRFAAAWLPALLALTLAGCGTDSSRVLARVGNRTLTIDDFVEAARDKESQYPGPPDSAKAMLLDDMVRATLVLCDAERLGLYKEPPIVGARERIESEETQQALYRQLVPTDVPVSDGEVEQLYAWRDEAAHVRVIQCASRSAAGAALNQIAHGARFDEMADRFGVGGGPPGGDLGYLLPGALLTPLDQYMREAPLHTLIGPVESPGEGWFLMEVLARRKRTQRPLEEQYLVLRDMLRQRKLRAIRLQAQQALRTTYDLRLEPGGAQAMFAFFNQAGGESARVDLAANDPRRATVLGHYGAGRAAHAYTLGDALVDLTDYGRERPDPAMVPSFERWIDAQLLRHAGVLEAQRRRLSQEPETVRKIARRVDSQVLDLYYDVEIAHGAETGPDDLRAAYDRSAGSYQRLDRVDLLAVTLPDSAAAAAVAAHAGHAPSLREAVAMASPGANVNAETVRYPGAPARWRSYQQPFMDTAPHGCVGPVKAAGGWLVVQVVAKEQVPVPLDQLPPDAAQSLRQQADEIARDRMFNARVEKLRGELKPELRRDRLRPIPWPVGPAAGATGA
jgi:parvulin-like peptidyl-prolyl isomerase